MPEIALKDSVIEPANSDNNVAVGHNGGPPLDER